MIKFLFQGDSITDADRRRDNDDNYGYGYPNLFAAEVLKNRPYEFEFINCGISGDRIVDVYARIKMDIINLKPDYMSLLIGVNDVWHELNEENGVAAPKFEKIYDMLISEIIEALPDIKIMLLEPFVLKGCGTERYYDVFREEVKKRSDAVKRIAEKYGLKSKIDITEIGWSTPSNYSSCSRGQQASAMVRAFAIAQKSENIEKLLQFGREHSDIIKIKEH